MAGTNNALNNSATVFQVDNLNLNGNVISSTNTSGSVQLIPIVDGNVQAIISGGGSVQAIGALVGSTVIFESLNTDNTNTASDAIVRARVGGTSAGDPYHVVSNSAGQTFGWGMDVSASNVLKETANGSPSAGTLLRQMTASGEQTMPLQPAFSAIQTSDATDVTGDGTAYTVICGTELYDQGSDYDNGTGVFTAPVTGRYHFNLQLLFQQLLATATCTIQLLTTARPYTFGNTGTSFVGNMPMGFGIDVPMTAGDTASFKAIVGNMTKVVDIYGNLGDARTCFSGHLIC